MLNARRRQRISAGTIRAGSQPWAHSRGQQCKQCSIPAWIGNRPAKNPVQVFLAFGDVSMLKPLLNEGNGTGLVFFCFGFLSSLPRRLLPFAILFSCARVGRSISGVFQRFGQCAEQLLWSLTAQPRCFGKFFNSTLLILV